MKFWFHARTLNVKQQKIKHFSKKIDKMIWIYQTKRSNLYKIASFHKNNFWIFRKPWKITWYDKLQNFFQWPAAYNNINKTSPMPFDVMHNFASPSFYNPNTTSCKSVHFLLFHPKRRFVFRCSFSNFNVLNKYLPNQNAAMHQRSSSFFRLFVLKQRQINHLEMPGKVLHSPQKFRITSCWRFEIESTGSSAKKS